MQNQTLSRVKPKNPQRFFTLYILFVLAVVGGLIVCHKSIYHGLAHDLLDALIVLLAPMFYAAFIYGRTVYIITFIISNLGALVAIWDISPEFVPSLFVLGIVSVSAVIACEFVVHLVQERDRAAQALRDSEDRVIHLQKMQAIGELTAGISHNFNNILSGVIGNLSLAYPKAPEDIRRYLEVALDSSRRAAELTRQLMLFCRSEVAYPKSLYVDRLIDEIANVCQSVFEKRIRLTVNHDSNGLCIDGDAGQLHQAILNLCINARDAVIGVPDAEIDPHIQIGYERISLDPELIQTRPRSDCRDYVRIEVKDNGIGMDEDTRKRIYEPFFTTKEVGKGTGLGLSTAFGIVEQHGGWIECVSEIGVGTTFGIFLPAGREQPAADPEPEQAMPSGRETILVVDDDECVRTMTKEMLEDYGYTVWLGCDGRDGLEVFAAHRKEIDLVLMDLNMPGMSGWESLRAMRETAPDIKAVVISGQAVESESGANADPILYKPFQWPHLLQAVRDAIDRNP